MSKQNETPVTEQNNNQPETTSAKLAAIDTLFSLEHQGMIASKYRVKYSDPEQEQHKAAWPQYVGNHFMLYILAETLLEAKKAVFSANKKLLLNSLTSAMSNYTPTAPGAVITDMQAQFNKVADMQLQALYEQIPDESQRVDLLKDFAKTLKLSSKNGVQTETARAKFAHAAATLGIVPATIW